MNLLKLIWAKLNFVIIQKKNSLHFFTLDVSKSHNITNTILFSSLRIHNGSKAYDGFKIM